MSDILEMEESEAVTFLNNCSEFQLNQLTKNLLVPFPTFADRFMEIFPERSRVFNSLVQTRSQKQILYPKILQSEKLVYKLFTNANQEGRILLENLKMEANQYTMDIFLTQCEKYRILREYYIR